MWFSIRFNLTKQFPQTTFNNFPSLVDAFVKFTTFVCRKSRAVSKSFPILILIYFYNQTTQTVYPQQTYFDKALCQWDSIESGTFPVVICYKALQWLL